MSKTEGRASTSVRVESAIPQAFHAAFGVAELEQLVLRLLRCASHGVSSGTVPSFSRTRLRQGEEEDAGKGRFRGSGQHGPDATTP